MHEEDGIPVDGEGETAEQQVRELKKAMSALRESAGLTTAWGDVSNGELGPTQAKEARKTEMQFLKRMKA